MIHLTRLNGSGFVLNADLIETLEATPDTVITLVTGRKYVVREGVEEIIEQVIDFRKKSGGIKIMISRVDKETEE
ncbi:MAG: flagellar FlbD family protein [Candidatus Caldatribacteriaceae bacterium]